MLKRLVYKKEELLGEVDLYLLTQNVELRERDIRITHFSQPGERCSPLAVLHTITSCGLCFKMESKMVSPDSPLFTMHSSCFRENKTAVMPLGSREELHLVAVSAGRNGIRYPCFWGFMTVPGLYSSCVCMLNLRCLGIVFDLDETLVVANTSRSFEDKIDSLQRKISAEADPQRVSAMLSEVKRYQEDKMMLKQYAETDQVVENGKIMRIQPEVFPALSDNHQPIIRPIIRLPEKNIILTRINPVIRDTSVLVRLRPGWEELRSYLTARGRKRFEVYVCTMAERDYALEMWRLLDPDSNLMNTNNLLDRIVCVKSGSKKSLLNVFQNGSCDPKMALVIDDRLRVWDERDQPRVHVVPAFAPYHSPQARENSSIPVLCVARNVACNVRGCFFRDFDDDLLQRISKVSYEDDIRSVPSQDVGNYLVSEDDGGGGGATTPNGMADVEIDRGLKESACSDPRILSSAQCTVSSSSPSSSLSCPVLPVQCCAREEGEVPESELDPDTRRRLLILQHGQDTRDHQSTAESSMNPRAPLLPPPPPPLPSWFPIEEAMSPGHNFSEPVTKKILMDIDPIDRHRNLSRTWFAGQGSSRFTNERDERLRWNRPPLGYRSESGPGQHCSPSPSPVSALNKISIRCGAKVEYRSSLVDSDDLNFLVQVLFSDEKVGEGSGRTRREAQRRAAELAIKTLAFKYLSNIRPDSNGLTDPRMEGSGWALAPPDTRHRKPGPVQDDLEAGILWDDVKVKASQFPQRRNNDPVQEVPGKRIKPEMPRFVPRMPSGRYSRNAPPPPGL